MDWSIRRKTQGSDATSRISSMSSSVISRSSASRPLTSMLFASIARSKTLSVPPRPCFLRSPRVPVMLILSPGRAMSTTSSLSSTFTDLGSCPAGSSSGRSWMVILWESMNTDSLGTSSNPRRLLQEGHWAGVFRNWSVWSRSIISPQAVHLYAALMM